MVDATTLQAQKGDPEALRRLITEFYPRVYRFCANRVGPDLAEDVAQDTFLTMHKNLRKFRGDSSFTTWIFGIAHNHCRNEMRRKVLAPLDEAPDLAEANPEEGVINRDLLRRTLQGLKPEHREVVILHELDEFTYAEISGILSIPIGTVKSRLHFAFIELRNRLQEVQA